MTKRRRIKVAGRVQGVGFRPAVYRIARSLGLSGFALNDTRGVTIELQGPEEALEAFLDRLKAPPDKPPLSHIESCEVEEIATVAGEEGFVIRASDASGSAASQVTADIATCSQCLGEMADENDFRHAYPFINCTNCGPRYSIVKTIPYDRPNTTMAAFEMCERCAAQYRDVADRRFHAQPVACPSCGPRVWLADTEGLVIEQNQDDAISRAVEFLKAGKIVAIKGIGGFHLSVDALNDDAVARLRERKRRDHKPFALMAGSVEAIRRYAEVSEQAEALLGSPESPIVLLPKREGHGIAGSVADGVGTFGFMLCYAPLHHLLFERGIEVLVMTSGNISDEPLICENDVALERLGDVADAFLMHNRDVYRQVDDSIVHLVAGRPAPLRRARGYVPTPVVLDKQCDKHIFAAGPDLKNTFCFVKGNQLICSEHIGDLEDAEVYHHYIESVEHLRGLFEVEPEVAVCDLHPGYFSTQYVRSLANVRTIEVQHHWAHVGCVLAEHHLEGPVIGIVCDGTGYGTDGAVWGCECLIGSLTSFERFGHLDYFQLAGADRASKEAIRPLISLLYKAFGGSFSPGKFEWLLGKIEPDGARQQIIKEQIDKGVNTVETSSLGRVFDAVAAVLGIGTRNHFDAQLPMALQAAIDESVADGYGCELKDGADGAVLLSLDPMIREMIADVRGGTPGGTVAAKFHNGVACGLLEMAHRAKKRTGLRTVALGGGVFCNQYLANRLIGLLKTGGFDVLFNHNFPSNDGCVSVGQAAIAAAMVRGE